MFHSRGYMIRKYNENNESKGSAGRITYNELTKLNKTYNQEQRYITL
jgi:hypothetical protein